MRFPGQYFDVETGLHYNWYRYYDPQLGRYISADLIGQLGGANVYTYSANSPGSQIDPFGLQGFDIGFWDAVSPELRQAVDDAIGTAREAQRRADTLRESTEDALFNAAGELAGADGAETIRKLREANDKARALAELCDRLSQAGREPDKGGRTRAGRALEKHGAGVGKREGEPYPRTTGNADQINEQGQAVLDEIVQNPESEVRPTENGGIDIVAPDGRTARYRRDGTFHGFRRPE